MTPLGAKLRQLRKERHVTLKEMAESLGVSSAYLSALEHGKRGVPTWFFIQRVISYFNLIWDDAEEIENLARLSDPSIKIDTAGLHPCATELANRLASMIGTMDKKDCEDLLAHMTKFKGYND
jgi:transcriptional regulator with XRE-family HTH domain